MLHYMTWIETKQTRAKYVVEHRYNDRFTLYRRPQIEACPA